MQTLCRVDWYDIALGVGMVTLDETWFGMERVTIHTPYQLTKGGRYLVELSGGRKRPVVKLPGTLAIGSLWRVNWDEVAEALRGEGEG